MTQPVPQDTDLTVKVTVFGVEYGLEMVKNGEFTFSGREWGTIKRISGTRPATMAEDLDAYDQELFVALAVVAMQRGGNAMIDIDKILDTAKSVEINFPEEADGAPPAVAAAAAGESQQSVSPMTPQLIGRQSSQGNMAYRRGA